MKYILILFLTLFFISCNTQPEPLVAGKDVCTYCKMPVAEIKFGGEIITAKGKIYKFDDLGCMINFIKSGMDSKEKVKDLLAVNYSNNQELLNVNEAAFLISSNFHTPMNSGAVCFRSKKEAEKMEKDFHGNILSWKELNQTFH